MKLKFLRIFTFIFINLYTASNAFSQNFKEILFFDDEKKGEGRLDFNVRLSDGLLIAGRFLEKDSMVSEVIKMDESGEVKWRCIFPDSGRLYQYPTSSVFSNYKIDSINNRLYIVTTFGKEYNYNNPKYYCHSINLNNGEIQWETKLPFSYRVNFTNSDYEVDSLRLFSYADSYSLPSTEIAINKANGKYNSINRRYAIFYDNKVQTYLIDSSNFFLKYQGDKLLWKVDKSDFKSIEGERYVEKRGKDLYILGGKDNIGICHLDFDNGKIIKNHIRTNGEVFPTKVEKINDAWHISCNEVSTRANSWSIMKYDFISDSIVWELSRKRINLEDTTFSTPKFTFDKEGNVHAFLEYTTSKGWPIAKSTNYCSYLKIDGQSKNIKLFKNIITDSLDNFSQFNTSSIGMYFIKEKLFGLGYFDKKRLNLLEIDINNGNIIKSILPTGNYREKSGLDYLMPTINQGVIAVKQSGKTLIVERYNANKQLEWRKSFEDDFAEIGMVKASVSPTGNIALVGLRGRFEQRHNTYVGLQTNEFYTIALDRNGRLLWKQTRDIGSNNAIWFRNPIFNDADSSIVVYFSLGNSSEAIFKFSKTKADHLNRNLNLGYSSLADLYLIDRKYLPKNHMAYLEGVKDSTYKFCYLNMNSGLTTNCISFQSYPYLRKIQLVPDNKMLVATANDLNGGYSEMYLYDLKTGNVLWNRRLVNTGNSGGTNVSEFTFDEATNRIYVLLNKSDSISFLKMNYRTGDIISRTFLFVQKERFNVIDFQLTPSLNSLIITGSTSTLPNEYIDNSFIAITDTSGVLYSQKLIRSSEKGLNYLGKGIVFFPDNTYWIGGGVNNTPFGKAGVIYESTYASQLGSVYGKIFMDRNKNQIFDSLDYPIKNGVVTTSMFNSYSVSDFSGNYNVYINPNIKDTIQVSTEFKYATYNPKFHSIEPTLNLKRDFSLTLPENLQDLLVNVTAITPPRSGFTNSYLLTYKNAGAITKSGKVAFTYNAKQTYVEATQAPTSNANNTLSWDYANLQPNETRTLKVTFKTAADVPIRTQLTNVATIEPIATDTFKTDNVDSLFQIVVGSYDPNDKQVSFLNTRQAPSVIDPNTEMTYTIRFQNTGNYQADFVRVTDTLSDKLDLTTLRVLATSHNYALSVKNKNVLQFEFNPIYLPDSTTNEKESHGFIKFAIKPKKTLTKDEVIKNTAYIFFDYNPAIITNTVETANQKVNGLFTPSVLESLSVFPNPTNGEISFSLDKYQGKALSINVYSIDGKLMMNKHTVGEAVNRINGESLRNGLYVLQVRVGDDVVFGRFMVQK